MVSNVASIRRVWTGRSALYDRTSYWGSVIGTLDVVRQARGERRDKDPMVRLIPSKVMSRTKMSTDFPDSLTELGELLLPGIGHRTVIRKAVVAYLE